MYSPGILLRGVSSYIVMKRSWFVFLAMVVMVQSLVIAWLVFAHNSNGTPEKQEPPLSGRSILPNAQPPGIARPHLSQTDRRRPESKSAHETQSSWPKTSVSPSRELVISYGDVSTAGAFLGETIKDQLVSESPSRLALYSVGPLIEAAEMIEADPMLFAQFEASMLGALLELDPKRIKQLETSLNRLKALAAAHAPGTREYNALDREGIDVVRGLLSQNEIAKLGDRFRLVEGTGVLMVSAWAVLPSSR